jgi:hypothetical protein
MDLNRPRTTTEVRGITGFVQYYRDMWRRCSNILSPLTEVSYGPKNKKLIWNDKLESAFLELKQMVLQEALMNYPDWSKPFDIHIDASDKQLGAVISQDEKPIAFFSQRLSKAQQNYTMTKKELLSIVE